MPDRTPMRRAAALLLACTLAACTGLDVHTTPYTGATRHPPGDEQAVLILREEPGRPHEELGQIVIESSDMDAPTDEVERRLRIEAAALGADAAVVVHDALQPLVADAAPIWYERDARAPETRKLVAVAIKFR